MSSTLPITGKAAPRFLTARVHASRQQPSSPDPFDRHASPRDKTPPPYIRANVSKKGLFSAPNRRRGRAAELRSPDDSPLRDGNRDRLIGLLTERAVKTLLVYLQETNPHVYQWLFCYLKDTPIPRDGSWDEISGEQFLRTMLATAPATTKYNLGRAELFDNMVSTGVDPRQIAQRVMEIRVQLSKEFVQDLGGLAEENSVLLRETLQVSLSNALSIDPIKQLPPRDTSKVFVHPELLVEGSLHPSVAESHPELLAVVKDQAAKQQLSVPTRAASSGRDMSPPVPSAPAAGPAGTIVSKTSDATKAPQSEEKKAPKLDASAATEVTRGVPDSHPNSRPSIPKQPWSPKKIPGIGPPNIEPTPP